MSERLSHLVGIFAAVFICLSSCTPATLHPMKPIKRWAAYYDDKMVAQQFASLDLVVFDGRYHPDLTQLKGKTILLAYVSMGEVRNDSDEKAVLADGDALLVENTTWKSHAVDLGAREWRQLVMGHVDKAIADGFDGVMLDTVDSPLEWARTQSPERLKDMQESAIRLIRAIRLKHPSIKIMLNRGFDILPEVSQYINFSLAESMLTEKDNFSGQFRLFPPITYSKAVIQLQHLHARAEHLQQFTLDYWDVDDVKGLERIYAMQRASGFVPYVTTQDLRRFTPEPGSRTPAGISKE